MWCISQVIKIIFYEKLLSYCGEVHVLLVFLWRDAMIWVCCCVFVV